MALSRLTAFVMALSLAPAATAQNRDMPPEMYGRYAAGGDCTRSPRITVNRAGIHLDTPAGQRSPLPIDVAFSWGGARYDGIQLWVQVIHGGKDRWGDDNKPVMLTFNAREKRGALSAERMGTGKERPIPLDGPLSSIVQTANFQRCGTSAAAPAPAAATPAPAAKPAPGAQAQSPAARFAAVVGALMHPASAPQGSYYDWLFIERAPGVKWAPLPPDSLDKPLSDGHYFRRNGTIALGAAPMKIMAAGARTMIFNHYFKNEGQALGEAQVVAALRASGLTVTTARCGTNPALRAPTWYRLSGGGKRPALLWVAQPRGASSPWEGFNLALDPTLKPMTPQERMVYTDRCP